MGGEGAPQGAALLAQGAAGDGLLPLAETCGDCPVLDLGMLGQGVKLTGVQW